MGKKIKALKISAPNTPVLQHSSTPVLHHSSTPLFFDGLLEELLLFDGHFTRSLSCPFVLISDQVKNAMNHQKSHHFHIVKTKSIRLTLSRFDRNGQITQNMGMECSILSFSHGESKDIGGFVSM